MDNLSPEEFQGYVDKFPEFKKKMTNLVNKYDYKYPEQPGSIPKYVDTENGRYTLIEETGGQMCDDLECTMIGHCVIKNDEDSYNPGTEPSTVKCLNTIRLYPFIRKTRTMNCARFALLNNH